MPLYIYGFIIAMVISYVVTPGVIKLSWKIGLLMSRSEGFIKPVPCLGGLAIFWRLPLRV